MDSAHFSDVHKVLDLFDKGGVAATPSKLYFSWLGWVLLAAVVISALIAVVPSPASAAFRGVGALVAVAGIVLTFLAIKLSSGSVPIAADNSGSYIDYLKEAGIAFYLAVAGFLLAGVGALVGPRRT